MDCVVGSLVDIGGGGGSVTIGRFGAAVIVLSGDGLVKIGVGFDSGRVAWARVFWMVV